MKLSLAIINDNGAPYLNRFFESLGSWRKRLDIVFVDNCSRDDSIEVAKDMGISKIVAFQDKTASRPVLYNAAASRANGDYILFAHSDIIFGDGLFEKLSRGLNQATRPDFVSFRVMYVDKTNIVHGTVYWNIEGEEIRVSYHSIWGIRDPALKKFISCSESCFLVGSNELGHERFDERYCDSFFIEDLILKLQSRGATVLCDEDSYVEHYFLEEHEKLRTLEHDSRLFVECNLKELQSLHIIEQDRQIRSLQTGLQEKIAEIQGLESHVHSLESRVHSLESRILQVERSIPMQLVRRYQRVVDGLLSPGTRRRRPYDLALTGVRVILNEGWRNFFRKATDWLARRQAATGRPRRELTKFNASISKKEAERLVFPVPSEAPEVTIVIPAYNQLVYTLNCLKSVCENTEGDYEVVVIDDASTDETADVLSKMKNIRLITNESNEGFLESCNRGAKFSKGKHILFLNNDTMVTKGWLPPLLELIKREDVGAVGSMLVYPNGVLQEAGGIIWNDGTGWNYGRGDNPDKPEYNYVREVDYCSGAALMVKRELLDQIGGFDERFKPAYYEDTDLCFAVRKLGYKVMYQPMSVVVHFEGITCGTDESSGTKNYQEVNRTKFAAKWNTALHDHHRSFGLDSLFLARDRRLGQPVLVIDHYVPTYDKDSGSLRMFNMLQALHELGHKVTFIGANLLRLEPYTQDLQQKGIEIIYSPHDLSARAYIERCGRSFATVILSRVHIAVDLLDVVKENCATARLIFDTVDLAFLRESRRAEVEDDEHLARVAQELKKTELHIARNSDITLVVSPVEKEILLKEEPSLSVEIVSNIHSVTPAKTPFSERKDILFVGGFDHVPNIDAVSFFVREIFPLVRQRLPDVCFYIVGSNPPKQVIALQDRDITVTGYVKDLLPYFEGCKLFVSPLRYGAGVKGKINQSMSHGLPVVTTAIGAEGIDLVDGENALIADTQQEFAEKTVRLYNSESLWRTISQNSLDNIRDHFSPEAAKRALERALAS